MKDLVQRHRDVIAPVIGYDTELVIEKAEGLWVSDADGNRWADFACGTAVTNLGHNHPAVVAAAHRQLDKVVHSGGVFRYDTLVEAAERLAEVTPSSIEKFGFANSGSEAVEAAVKLARKTTGRPGVVVFRGGFHGRTMGAVTYTTSSSRYRQGYQPLVGGVFVTPFPHPYRWGISEDEATTFALTQLELLFRHEILPSEVAALLVEPVQGEGGYYPAPPAFLSALRVLCDHHGMKLVYDEIQTGFGRTAEWFATSHYGVEPDIIALGKGIANGLPLSAYGASAKLMDSWERGSHGTTFGGNPVACAAALAVMDTLPSLLPHARELARQAIGRLDETKTAHPTIGDVRHLGLMIGVELVADRATREPDSDAFGFLQGYCLARGLIIIDCGPEGSIIRFIPPLVTTLEELDWALDILDDGLTAYEAR